VLVPESGDDIQMMKAGILEIADILTVNKCDRQGSDHIVKELRAMLELAMGEDGTWQIPVLKTVAEKAIGIEAVYEMVGKHREFLKRTGQISQKRAHFAKTAILHIVRDMAARDAEGRLNSARGQEILAAVSERELDPFTAAEKLLH